MAKPDLQVGQSGLSLFGHLAKFVEKLKNLEEENLYVALSGVVGSRNKLRAFVTQGMAPQSLVNALRDAPWFAQEGALFTESSLKVADSIATEKFGLGFEPAKGSMQAERALAKSSVSRPGTSSLGTRSELASGLVKKQSYKELSSSKTFRSSRLPQQASTSAFRADNRWGGGASADKGSAIRFKGPEGQRRSSPCRGASNKGRSSFHQDFSNSQRGKPRARHGSRGPPSRL